MPSLIEKIGQMLYVGFPGLTAPDYILDWLQEGRIGGVILFARNVETPQQLAALTQSLHDAAKTPILIGIDQEGGSVARMRSGFTESPGSMALGAADNAVERTEQVAGVLGKEMRALGINWDYAPVVDISYNADNPTVGTRSFGPDAERIGTLASAMVRGLEIAGVAACAKHFPGLGDTAVDTHLALAQIDQSVEHLLAYDLVPYRHVIAEGIASVMTTHTLFTELDEDYPATLSPVIISRLLRAELDFKGVVCSDCMEMKAIADHYGSGESAVLGALAGLDAILISHTRSRQEEAMAALYEAATSGRLPLSTIEASNERIAIMKERFSITGALHPETVNTPEHQQIALDAARAGVTLLRANDTLFPVRQMGQVALIEFASWLDSEVMEQGGLSGLAQAVTEHAPFITTLSLKAVDHTPQQIEAATTLAAESNLLILATRNAHLIPEEAELAQKLATAAQNLIVVCLRNPYDAALFPQAETILCTAGDSAPSLVAALQALQGQFTPQGTLPVEVS